MQELDLVLRKSLKAKREGMKAPGMFFLRGAAELCAFCLRALRRLEKLWLEVLPSFPD